MATPTSAPNLEELPLEDKASSLSLSCSPPPYYENFTDEDLPPLRMHATRVPERLSSSTSSIIVPPALLGLAGVRRKSNDSKTYNPRSRSRSPSLRMDRTATTLNDNSSLSSLEDLVDSDILTDKMGLEELDFEKQHSNSQLMHTPLNSLPPVNERLSDESLDDVHAFSDVKASLSGTISRGTSIATGGDVGSLLLETLDECEDEEDDIEEEREVIFTNMENLTILEHDEEDKEEDDTVRTA